MLAWLWPSFLLGLFLSIAPGNEKRGPLMEHTRGRMEAIPSRLPFRVRKQTADQRLIDASNDILYIQVSLRRSFAFGPISSAKWSYFYQPTSIQTYWHVHNALRFNGKSSIEKDINIIVITHEQIANNLASLKRHPALLSQK